MAQLWGGRFTKETDQLVYRFNASIGFDQKFYRQDIQGSMAHVRMLAKQGILTEEEKEQILKGLESILEDVENHRLEITEEYEDIHSFVEANLIQRIGDAGKKLHTGRSRNDQVALDMKLYVRDEVWEMDRLVLDLLKALQKIMEENLHTYMPGFTHLQKAQPITLAHHMGAYFEMFRRDRGRLHDIYQRMNYCPLGSGALAGTTYPLDREYTASLLEFEGATRNSMDSVSDRDYVIELLSAMSTIMMHLSRFCEEIIIWNTNEYQFVEIDDAYSTGSSIMPQKKNPDIAELVRGKTGRVYGALVSILTTMKGLPLAYNKDMQEDKELTFDAIDTVKGCLALFTGMISTMRFRKDRMEASAKNGFTNATDAADYLVGKGVPFRDAHGIVGRLVLYCLEKDIALDDMTLEEYKAISPVFEEDIYEAISMKNCVEKRNTIGAPGAEAMQRVLEENRRYLEQENF
ncbi:argininosuccinate lyase [Lacrimispora saccharolytica]|nr:argininosuccinate lyase [Lacrimispora saccharolytica]